MKWLKLLLLPVMSAYLLYYCTSDKSTNPLVGKTELVANDFTFDGDTILLIVEFADTVLAADVQWIIKSNTGLFTREYDDTTRIVADTAKYFRENYPTDTLNNFFVDSILVEINGQEPSNTVVINVRNIKSKLDSILVDGHLGLFINGFYRIPGNPNSKVTVELFTTDKDGDNLQFSFKENGSIALNPIVGAPNMFEAVFQALDSNNFLDTVELQITDTRSILKVQLLFINYNEVGVLWVAGNPTGSSVEIAEVVKYTPGGIELLRTQLNTEVIRSMDRMVFSNNSMDLLVATISTVWRINEAGKVIAKLSGFTSIKQIKVYDNREWVYVLDVSGISQIDLANPTTMQKVPNFIIVQVINLRIPWWVRRN